MSGSDDFTIFLWEPSKSKKPLGRMTGHLQLINQVGLVYSCGVWSLLGITRWPAAGLVTRPLAGKLSGVTRLLTISWGCVSAAREDPDSTCSLAPSLIPLPATCCIMCGCAFAAILPCTGRVISHAVPTSLFCA